MVIFDQSDSIIRSLSILVTKNIVVESEKSLLSQTIFKKFQ